MHPSGDFEGFSPQSRPPDFRDQILAQADDAVARIELRAKPKLDEYGVPVQEKRARTWPYIPLYLAVLAFGIWRDIIAVQTETAQHGVRWHTHHYGADAPGFLVILAAIVLAVWKEKRGEKSKKSKLGWLLLLLAVAAGIFAVWTLSMVQPYSDSGGA